MGSLLGVDSKDPRQQLARRTPVPPSAAYMNYPMERFHIQHRIRPDIHNRAPGQYTFMVEPPLFTRHLGMSHEQELEIL